MGRHLQLMKGSYKDVEQVLKFVLGELKDGLLVPMEALYMKVLVRGHNHATCQ
jgi:hypothetical protein